jgi:hypothetical protein
MNRIAITVLLSAIAFGASAQTPTADPAVQADQAVQVDADSADVTVITGTETTNDRNCLRETGSHLTNKQRKECVSANGSSYSREDIDRTGATTLGEALARLSPSVQVSHH